MKTTMSLSVICLLIPLTFSVGCKKLVKKEASLLNSHGCRSEDLACINRLVVNGRIPGTAPREFHCENDDAVCVGLVLLDQLEAIHQSKRK